MDEKQYLKQCVFPATVFLTGACVLVIEIVAIRILSPYFGNTLYTFSSIISVILAALSIGYAVGGRLADRFSSEKLFFGLIILGGGSVFLLYGLMHGFLPLIAYRLSIVSGSLIAASALFFLPAFLLGLLSPYAIKLQASRFPERGIGSVSGSIFFWSTLGSILGSLSTGFVLIPRLGVDAIVLLVATVLFSIGVLGMAWSGISKTIAIMLVGLFVAGHIFLVSFPSTENALYTRESQYQKLSVVDASYAGIPTRYFLQDQAPSGAMYLHSDELVFEYTRYYELYKLMKPDLREALVIGGGIYSIPKALLREHSSVHVDVSEIDPALLAIGEQYFGVSNNPRLTHYVMDGRRMLRTTTKEYDLIFSDVYYSFSIPAHLATKEFFTEVKEKLSPEGIFLVNMVGTLSPETPSLLLSEMRTFMTVFPNSYFFAVDPEHPEEGQNFVLVGYNSQERIDFFSSSAGVTSPFLASLPSKLVDTDQLNLVDQPLITDDYAPVEYLMARLVSTSGVRPFSLELK